MDRKTSSTTITFLQTGLQHPGPHGLGFGNFFACKTKGALLFNIYTFCLFKNNFVHLRFIANAPLPKGALFQDEQPRLKQSELTLLYRIEQVFIADIEASSSRKLGFEQDGSYFVQNRGAKNAHPALSPGRKGLSKEEGVQKSIVMFRSLSLGTA